VFEDSLFATNQHRSGQRGLAAVLSFGVQAVFLGLLVLIPLLYTDALPLNTIKTILEAPRAPVRPASEPAPQPVRHNRTDSNMENGRVVTPIVIPPHPAQLVDRGPIQQGVDDGPVIPGAIPDLGSDRANSITRLLHVAPGPAAPSVSTNRGPVRISHVDEGLLIHKVTPIYPKMAITIRQQGPVTLQATIGRDGTIQNLRLISGPPLLIGAAIDAVKQWRYRPYLLNGEAVEVETQITVNFTLGG